MLKITTCDNGNRTLLELNGKLVGPWVNELDKGVASGRAGGGCSCSPEGDRVYR